MTVNHRGVTWPYHRLIRSCVLYVWTNVQNVQNLTESTAIIQKVRLVCDPRLKRIIRRLGRDRIRFEVVEVIRGIGGVHFQ